MAGTNAQITVDVELGPVFEAGLAVLEYATDVLDVIPEQHEAERTELAQRGIALRDALARISDAHKPT